MKILFAGTPDIAVPSLQALAAHYDVGAVLTAPDSGRGRRLQISPVKQCALDLGIRVLQPERLDARARQQAAGFDLMAVFAYGRIFGPRFLSLFPLGALNMHPSALPVWRGPSPLTAAILAGAEQTAMTVQLVSEQMDAGDILRQTPFPLNGRETTESLSKEIGRAAAPELLQAVGDFVSGRVKAIPQNHDQATYCHIVTKNDGLIDWNKPAEQIEREVRAYTPWPHSRTTFRDSGLLILESAALPQSAAEFKTGTVTAVDKSQGILIQTGHGILAVKRLQRASGKAMDFRSFLNGVRLERGTVLGEQQ